MRRGSQFVHSAAVIDLSLAPRIETLSIANKEASPNPAIDAQGVAIVASFHELYATSLSGLAQKGD